MVNATASTAPRSFKDVWLLAAGHGLTHWYTATFFILLPLIGRELGLSYTEIGLIMTVQNLAGAVSNLPGGMLVDLVGKKGYLLAASLFWVGFPYALMSLTESFWMLLACVTLVGIGNNLWHPAALPTLALRYPESKGLAISVHGMGGNIGEALAPLVVGALLAVFNWRAVVVMNVVPGIVMALLILALLGAFSVGPRGAAAVNAPAQGSSLALYLRAAAGLLRNRALMLISVSSAFRTMTQVGLLTFVPVYLAYELGYPPFLVGAAMTAMQVAGFVASPLGGYLSDRIGRKSVALSSMAVSAVLIAAMAAAGKSAAFVLLVALVGFFLYAVRGVLQAWVVESTPAQLAGSAIGVQFGVQAAGGAVAPAVFGLIADASDLYTAFYFLAGTIVAGNLLILFLPNGAAQPAKEAAA